MQSFLHSFPPEAAHIEAPQQFTFPFCYTPHPLCQIAAKEVMEYCYNSEEMYPKEGKMLVVEHEGQRYYLRAFSGIYNGSYHHEGFVPTIYDLQNPDGYFHEEEQSIDAITQQINNTADDEEVSRLKILRKEKSNALQMWTFRQFRMHNAFGDIKDLTEIFKDFKSPYSVEEYLDYKEGRTKQKPKSKVGIPPGGAGECCAPKLLQYAYQHHLRPLCMAEFWIGPPPKDELRTEGNYYPACQHKCRPILTHMLQGLDVEENPMLRRNREMLSKVRTIYEDDYLLVVYKPSGLLSIPGKEADQPSLLSHLRQSYPEAMLPHRLDMDTSGVMLAAKNENIYKQLQAMFYRHEIQKKYIALLDPASPASQNEIACGSKLAMPSPSRVFTLHSPLSISLPLSPNPFDRPRQMVNHEHGKQAITRYEFIDDNLVALYPETGRTHQLRVHCAHPEGLNRPIKGDNLYGTPSDRLYLHAESITFLHPVTGERMSFEEKEEW